uniref:Metallothionein n=1 Tax=Plectus sambesii TaxID=2011161 RepID=A0A914WNZ5_9BILA
MPKCDKCCGENQDCGCPDPCECDMEKKICKCTNCMCKNCFCHGEKGASATGEKKTCCGGGSGEGSHEGH